MTDKTQPERVQKYQCNITSTAVFIPEIDAYRVTDSTGLTYHVRADVFKSEFDPIIEKEELFDSNGEKQYKLKQVILEDKDTGELRCIDTEDFNYSFVRVQ